jgi:probable rRNA maturation factor
VSDRSNLMVTVDVRREAKGWKAVPSPIALVRKAARKALALGGVALLPEVEVAVLLSDDARICDANRQWRAKDKPTNVLSFPAVSPDRISTAPYLGDVILAWETVAAEAEQEGKTAADHMVHLVVHGVLHLIGYDHMTASDARRMESLEKVILASLGVADPYAEPAPLENRQT